MGFSEYKSKKSFVAAEFEVYIMCKLKERCEATNFEVYD